MYPGETAECQHQRWPRQYFLLGCGPCAHTCIPGGGGRGIRKCSLEREEAPSARGISDETGQAITDKTCRNASLSRRAPGRRPMNWQSLARGPAPREEGVWPQPFPSVWGCLPGTRARTWVGLVCGQHLFNSMHMCEERALGSRKSYICGWRQVRPRSRVEMFQGRSWVKSEKSPRGGSFACETWLWPLGS